MTELTISEVRKALLDLPEKLARTPERAVTITRSRQPVLAILLGNRRDKGPVDGTAVLSALALPHDRNTVAAGSGVPLRRSDP